MFLVTFITIHDYYCLHSDCKAATGGSVKLVSTKFLTLPRGHRGDSVTSSVKVLQISQDVNGSGCTNNFSSDFSIDLGAAFYKPHLNCEMIKRNLCLQMLTIDT